MLIHAFEILESLPNAGMEKLPEQQLPQPIEETKLWQMLIQRFRGLSIEGYFYIKQNDDRNTMYVGIERRPGHKGAVDNVVPRIADILAADSETADIEWEV